MTDRKEIERLLNATGRTLDSLPSVHPEDERRAAGGVCWITAGMAGKMILHQNDVIELLVDALRDALKERETE